MFHKSVYLDTTIKNIEKMRHYQVILSLFIFNTHFLKDLKKTD